LNSVIVTIAEVIATAMRKGGKLLIAGNGGSAADAQHIAGEFLSRLNFDRNPLPAIALSTDTSVLTAIGKDYGFESLFERQIRGLGPRRRSFSNFDLWQLAQYHYGVQGRARNRRYDDRIYRRRSARDERVL
jgi:SIS domain